MKLPVICSWDSRAIARSTPKNNTKITKFDYTHKINVYSMTGTSPVFDFNRKANDFEHIEMFKYK